MITLEHVVKAYEAGVPALNDVNLHIEPGEFVFITGASGSGKSTIIELLLHELKPTSGKIIVDGQDLSKLKRRKIPMYRRKIGAVFQDFRLLQDKDVYENVAFAMRVTQAKQKDIKERVPLALRLVGLAGNYKSLPKQLSGGEMQRVAIARAIVNNPDLVLADEPTGNLDNKNAWDIMQLLDLINQSGTTVVVVTHNMEIVKVMKKRVITLSGGKVVNDTKYDSKGELA